MAIPTGEEALGQDTHTHTLDTFTNHVQAYFLEKPSDFGQG